MFVVDKLVCRPLKRFDGGLSVFSLPAMDSTNSPCPVFLFLLNTRVGLATELVLAIETSG
jgi:hypothetical protein